MTAPDSKSAAEVNAAKVARINDDLAYLAAAKVMVLGLGVTAIAVILVLWVSS